MEQFIRSGCHCPPYTLMSGNPNCTKLDEIASWNKITDFSQSERSWIESIDYIFVPAVKMIWAQETDSPKVTICPKCSLLYLLSSIVFRELHLHTSCIYTRTLYIESTSLLASQPTTPPNIYFTPPRDPPIHLKFYKGYNHFTVYTIPFLDVTTWVVNGNYIYSD